jgi:hypothetical protein
VIAMSGFRIVSSGFAAAVLLAGGLGLAQDTPLEPGSSVAINFPSNSPVTLISADMGESRASARGSAMIVDLRNMVLKLRNGSGRRIRGLTMLVSAQEVTPGGKASVAVPYLDAAPGEVFPLPINIRLLRSLQAQGGPLVRVGLDGILFDDFSFYGPNLLDSKRSMMVWETEAQRDRQHFKSVLASYGPSGLQQLALDSLNRQASRQQLDVKLSRGGRSTSAAAGTGTERVAQFAFLQFPDSPVQPIEGSARIAGDEARSPHIEVRNRSSKPIRYFAIGWIVKDSQGKEFWAASVPASGNDLNLQPGQTAQTLEDTASLRFSQTPGGPVNIRGMTGFVSQVEYTDGKIWVPNRASIENTQLLRVLAPSPEEQRLTDLYRNKGLNALIEELKKF